jgi:hypothetical protein
MLGEVKKTTVCQVKNTGMNTAKHRNPAEKDTRIQSIIGEQQQSWPSSFGLSEPTCNHSPM